MEYRIENFDFELRIVGKSKCVKISSVFKKIFIFWNNVKKDGFM